MTKSLVLVVARLRSIELACFLTSGMVEIFRVSLMKDTEYEDSDT